MMMRMSLVTRLGWGTPSMFTSSGGNVELVVEGGTSGVVLVIVVRLGILEFWVVECVSPSSFVSWSGLLISDFIRLRTFIILCRVVLSVK